MCLSRALLWGWLWQLIDPLAWTWIYLLCTQSGNKGAQSLSAVVHHKTINTGSLRTFNHNYNYNIFVVPWIGFISCSEFARSVSTEKSIHLNTGTYKQWFLFKRYSVLVYIKENHRVQLSGCFFLEVNTDYTEQGAQVTPAGKLFFSPFFCLSTWFHVLKNLISLSTFIHTFPARFLFFAVTVSPLLFPLSALQLPAREALWIRAPSLLSKHPWVISVSLLSAN